MPSSAPADNPLFGIADGCERDVGAEEGLTDERVLICCAVLELVKEYVAVRSAQPCQDERALFEDPCCERNEIIEGDLGAGDPLVADREVGVQLVPAGQHGTEPPDQPVGEPVEGLAV